MMAGLRVMMGGIFLAVWVDNLRKDLYTPERWADFVQEYADTTKVGFYADVLNDYVIPNVCSLVGFPLSVQAAGFNIPNNAPWVLSNAQDLVLGF